MGQGEVVQNYLYKWAEETVLSSYRASISGCDALSQSGRMVTH